MQRLLYQLLQMTPCEGGWERVTTHDDNAAVLRRLHVIGRTCAAVRALQAERRALRLRVPMVYDHHLLDDESSRAADVHLHVDMVQPRPLLQRAPSNQYFAGAPAVSAGRSQLHVRVRACHDQSRGERQSVCQPRRPGADVVWYRARRACAVRCRLTCGSRSARTRRALSPSCYASSPHAMSRLRTPLASTS